MTSQPAEVSLEAEVLVFERFSTFIKDFELPLGESSQGQTSTRIPSSQRNRREYVKQLDLMKEYDKTTLFVNYQHLLQFDSLLASALIEEYYRFEPTLRRSVLEAMKLRHADFVQYEGKTKQFFVSFFNLPAKLPIRSLRMTEIGTLVAVNGTVTRTSEVRPELMYGVFKCALCGTMSETVEQQFKFTEPTQCKNERCQNVSKWELQLELSTFVDWQRVRVQENSDEIPPGSMPRTLDVVMRNDSVERAKPGDKCTFTGTLVVVPDVGQMYRAGEVPKIQKAPAFGRDSSAMDGVSGLKSLGVRELTYRTAFLACSVSPEGSRQPTSAVDAAEENMSPEEAAAAEIAPADRQRILDMSQDSRLYHRMVKSIAPTVHGHDEVKRGILLMLFGGVHKNTTDNIRLRGDINVCIVGDPAVAKSQFLKYASRFAPRAVYTSGKASSAAGLTASVVKDADTGEFTIEAGALMLADNGICCIDEFDKMDPADQVAIHEAMEQQTITVTKAGIQATLNARASILAAANPVYGRYDRSKTLRHNVNIPPPIMSRFDLFFVVLDDCNETTDGYIARHIVNLHKDGAQAMDPPYSMEDLQKYVKFARSFNPELTEEAREEIVRSYKKLRQSDAMGVASSAYRITVRQLESMIRLSEALARLHLDDYVRVQYVKEAFRLLQKSIIHVESPDIEFEEPEFDEQPAVRSSETTEDDSASPTQGESQSQPEPLPTQRKRTINLSFERYQQIARMLALYLRTQEEEAADNDDEEAGSVKQEDLVVWYLQQIDEPDSEEELILQKRIVEKVIDHLIANDGVLVIVKEAEDINARLLACNPDFTVE